MPATLAPPTTAPEVAPARVSPPKRRPAAADGDAKVRAALKKERAEADRERLFDSFNSRHLWNRISWPVLVWVTAMHVGAVAAFFFVTWQAVAVAFALHWLTLSHRHLPRLPPLPLPQEHEAADARGVLRAAVRRAVAARAPPSPGPPRTACTTSGATSPATRTPPTPTTTTAGGPTSTGCSWTAAPATASCCSRSTSPN